MDALKMVVKIGDISETSSFSSLPGIVSGPVALC
jgi:hypothetical protein